MSSRRVQKAAEAVREVVSMAILTDLKDPRVRDVTVTSVEVSPDMRQAKVHVSVMGDETRQQLSLRGLQNAAGFLQSKVARRIDTRYTPRLTFMLDLGVKHSIEISRLLQQVLPPAQSHEPTSAEAYDENDLEGSDLEGSDLEGSEVEGSEVEGSEVEGSEVEGSEVEGCDQDDETGLTGPKGLIEERMPDDELEPVHDRDEA